MSTHMGHRWVSHSTAVSMCIRSGRASCQGLGGCAFLSGQKHKQLVPAKTSGATGPDTVSIARNNAILSLHLFIVLRGHVRHNGGREADVYTTECIHRRQKPP